MRLILIICFLLCFETAYSQQYPSTKSGPPTMEDILAVKETFRYEVTYGFLNLGNVTVEIIGDTTYAGHEHLVMKTKINASPPIPFVSDEEDHFTSFFFVNEDGSPVESKYWKDN